jgi:hypothetical protein
MEIAIASSSIALVLYAWLETDAFVEYFKLFRLDRGLLFSFLRVNEYEEYISKNLEEDTTYPDFLSYECGNFLTTLISCPICLSVWLSIFSGFYLSFSLFPVINIISIALFLLLKILFKQAYDGSQIN